MNQKDKAKELVDKFIYYVEAFSSKQQDENAKQCALIAVKEILSQFSWKPSTGLSYWQEVKTEIEKL